MVKLQEDDNQRIKELLSTKVLNNIKDLAVQNVLRSIIFDPKNSIDWNKVYGIMRDEMSELMTKIPFEDKRDMFGWY